MNRKHLTRTLTAALAAAALTACSGSENTANDAAAATIAYNPDSAAVLPIAYINMDTLLATYQFAVDAQQKLEARQDAAERQLDQRARSFQNQVNSFQSQVQSFQQKVQTNSFLSQDRAESEQNRLAREEQRLGKEQQNIEQLRAKLAQDIIEENQQLNAQFRDSVDTYLAIFNADRRYQLILTHADGDQVLYYDPRMDITAAVVSGLNARMGVKTAKTAAAAPADTAALSD